MNGWATTRLLHVDVVVGPFFLLEENVVSINNVRGHAKVIVNPPYECPMAMTEFSSNFKQVEHMLQVQHPASPSLRVLDKHMKYWKLRVPEPRFRRILWRLILNNLTLWQALRAR